ncbi:MAG: N-acetyltransferase [Burkholderiales bacterium]|nr:MAG: N-acetyltransferase [Burkholderiales bacterium]
MPPRDPRPRRVAGPSASGVRADGAAALPVLSTRDVVLRAVRPGDLPRWLAYLQQEPVRQHISWRPGSVDDLAEFVESTTLASGARQIRFAIARAADDALVGTVGLHSIVREHRVAEIAYDLDPACWGRGLATAACQAVLAWARTQGLHRIQASVLDGNLASARVLQRCQFSQEGLMRGCRWVDGVPRDVRLFSHLPTDDSAAR